MKRFPVMMNYQERKRFPECPTSVPWGMLVPHEPQALRNHDQTLQRLAERGGMGVREILFVLTDRRWKWEDIGKGDDAADVAALIAALKEYESTTQVSP